MAEADFRLLSALMDDLTPLAGDCGRVCGAACCGDCRPAGLTEGPCGMRLFPGEAVLLTGLPGFTLLPDENGVLLVCEGRCDRRNRPLACRFFPLFPHLDAQGRIRAVYDPRAWRVCPLVREHRHVPLQPAFVRGVRHVGRLLTEDPACREELRRQAAEIDEINRFLRLEEGRAPICRKSP